jgi:flavin reductase (DIM6/NTAB) family NADH-FMN oxidoreductase RutF
LTIIGIGPEQKEIKVMKELSKNEAIILSSPLPFVLVTALDENDRPNAIGISWVTITSWNPWLFVISVAPDRYSHRCIEHSGEFVINYPSEELAKAAWMCSTQSGKKADKFKEFGIEAIPALKVKPPRIKWSTLCIECKVIDHFSTGDHTVFVGEVVATSGDPERLRHLYCIHYTRLVSLDNDGNGNFELVFK